jgi:hypothetical protein
MTCIDTTSKRRLSAKLAAGLAISVLLFLGAGIGTARADDDHRGRGGWERQENHHENGHWTGGYYRAPPVVYAAPGYYAPPPAVYYGSGIGVTLPGINLNFR